MTISEKTRTQPKGLEIRFFEYIRNPDIDTSMLIAKREYSNNQYNKAADVLRDKSIPDSEKNDAYLIVNNWREIHSIPLQAFVTQLAGNAPAFDLNVIIAQRIKRLSSINKKLGKLSTKLCQIQDIGGCRLIFDTVTNVNRFINFYEQRPPRNWEQTKDKADSILTPRATGYRSVHLIYKLNDARSEYNGVKIELQVRSRLQHIWATAVETVGTFLGQDLKGGEGDEGWLRFFAIMSSFIAIEENCPLVPGTPDEIQDLKNVLWVWDSKVKALECLRGFQRVVKQTPSELKSKSHYYVITLTSEEYFGRNPVISIAGFKKDEYSFASSHYLDLERLHRDSMTTTVALVSTESIADLEAAYPNYFLDIETFNAFVEKCLPKF